MLDVTLALALLLASGILLAKIVQMFSLPSVTGFILAGLLLGPSGFSLVTAETVGHNLDHFTQIALMLIAFGIGEHLELRRLGTIARQVASICSAQAVLTLALTTMATFFVSWLISPYQSTVFLITLSLLLGSVAIANAPASVLHMVQELDARGPMTSTLMAVIAFSDGLAIAFFGVAVSIAHQVVAPQETSFVTGILNSGWEIGGSLAIGILTGLLIDYVLHKTHHRGEMLTAGLALLLLCGELTRVLALSPLLAGMTAGFILINRSERDSRLFRVLNGFEPPVHVLFFTLAGVHIDLSTVAIAGWVGLAYFIARLIGKYYGSWVGAYLCKTSPVIRNNIGLGLFPQAGIAIGLVFIINSDDSLHQYAEVMTPIILAGVILAELIGPIPAKKAFLNSKEAQYINEKNIESIKIPLIHHFFGRPDELRLKPWPGNMLHPVSIPSGVVCFRATDDGLARALARVATILAHYYNATPKSIRDMGDNPLEEQTGGSEKSSFFPEIDEAKSLGYPILTKSLEKASTDSLLQAVRSDNSKALVIGYPLGKNPLSAQKTVNKIVKNAPCPVAAVRFIGTFSCENILVSFVKLDELELMTPLLEAFAIAREPKFTLLQLLNSESSHKDMQQAHFELKKWTATNLLEVSPTTAVMPVDSRLEAILREAKHHDLVIVKSTLKKGIKRIFLGSLSLAIVTNCTVPVLTYYPYPDQHIS